LESARRRSYGAITSKIKHAIKRKTSPARLAQLLHKITIAALISILFLLAANDGVSSMTGRYGTPSLAAS